jgi:pantoate--beta-alanine ligase
MSPDAATLDSNEKLNMLLFKKASDLKRHLKALRKLKKTVGFTPTMGALHEGHLSLIRRSNLETNCSVCSIFVNPTQFNDPSDLEKYPRTPGKDLGLLAEAKCSVVFMPDVAEVYPSGFSPKKKFDFGTLETTMEGKHRPGHFAGMAQVVNRLLELVKPDKLYMGQKDFQQQVIVANMLQQLRSPIQLVRCPIIRESDGLAMSSRNVRLSPEQRSLAVLISRTLLKAKSDMENASPAQIEREAMKRLDVPGMVPEYFDIVDGRTLQPVLCFDDSDFIVACAAAKVGEVRLIDNMILKEG